MPCAMQDTTRAGAGEQRACLGVVDEGLSRARVGRQLAGARLLEALDDKAQRGGQEAGRAGMSTVKLAQRRQARAQIRQPVLLDNVQTILVHGCAQDHWDAMHGLGLIQVDRHVLGLIQVDRQVLGLIQADVRSRPPRWTKVDTATA
eukprot:355181-Chlamydomonas_euryale.AAC.7